MTNESNHTQGSASLCFISVCFLTDVNVVCNSLVFNSSCCAVLGWGCSLQQRYLYTTFFLLRVKTRLRTVFPSESTNVPELLPALAVITWHHGCEGHGLAEIRGALAKMPIRPGLWFDSSAFSRGNKDVPKKWVGIPPSLFLQRSWRRPIYIPFLQKRDWAWKSRAGHPCRQGISFASVHKSSGDVQADPILNSFCSDSVVGDEAVCRSGTCTQELTLGWQQLLQERAREHMYGDPKEHFGELCVSWRFNVL